MFFELMCLPPEYVNVILQLKAPIALIIHGGGHLSSLIHPTSGVRQGCPLSPTIFAMVISPIISKLHSLSCEVTVLLYLDDLLIIASGLPGKTASLLHQCWTAMKEFQTITGLHVNSKKSAILVLGNWQLDAGCTA